MDKSVFVNDAIQHFNNIIEATDTKSDYNEGFVDGLEFCISHLATMLKLSERHSDEENECDPRADVYYLAEKIGIHQLYALVVALRGEPEPCEDCVSREAVINITIETGALETQSKVKELPSVKPRLQECEDAVSRYAVIRAIDKHTDEETATILDDDISCILEEVPTVKPKLPECDDAVSRNWIRQDISDAINEMTKIGIVVDGDWLWGKINDSLDNAPFVIPKPKEKVGKWNFIGHQMFECANCGVTYTQSQFRQMRVRICDPEFPRFCPYCGSRNETEGAEQNE